VNTQRAVREKKIEWRGGEVVEEEIERIIKLKLRKNLNFHNFDFHFQFPSLRHRNLNFNYRSRTKKTTKEKKLFVSSCVRGGEDSRLIFFVDPSTSLAIINQEIRR
jgi:hypothetical protein